MRSEKEAGDYEAQFDIRVVSEILILRPDREVIYQITSIASLSALAQGGLKRMPFVRADFFKSILFACGRKFDECELGEIRFGFLFSI